MVLAETTVDYMSRIVHKFVQYYEQQIEQLKRKFGTITDSNGQLKYIGEWELPHAVRVRIFRLECCILQITSLNNHLAQMALHKIDTNVINSTYQCKFVDKCAQCDFCAHDKLDASIDIGSSIDDETDNRTDYLALLKKYYNYTPCEKATDTCKFLNARCKCKYCVNCHYELLRNNITDCPVCELEIQQDFVFAWLCTSERRRNTVLDCLMVKWYYYVENSINNNLTDFLRKSLYPNGREDEQP